MKKLITTLLFFILCGPNVYGQWANTITIQGSGAPSGTCSAIMRYVDTATGDTYSCKITAGVGSWILSGSSSGLSGSGTTNAITKWTGTATLGNSTLVDDGSTVASTNPISIGASAAGSGSLRLPNGVSMCWEASPAGTDFCITGNSTETVSIDVNLGIGNTTPSTYNPFTWTNLLVVGNGTTSSGINILSATNSTASAYCHTDAAAGLYDQGCFIYNHNTDSAIFSTARSTRLTLVAASSTFTNRVIAPLFSGTTNCADSAGAAACGAAPVGAVVIDAAATSVVVSTTAVTTNSRIMVTEDSSLATELGITCNTTISRTYAITARSNGVSFTITTSAAPVTNPACLSYQIFN